MLSLPSNTNYCVLSMKHVFGRAILRTGITLKAIPVPFSTFLEILIIRYNVSMMWFCRSRTLHRLAIILFLRKLIPSKMKFFWFWWWGYYWVERPHCVGVWIDDYSYSYSKLFVLPWFLILLVHQGATFSPDISFSFARITLASCWLSSFLF